MARILMAPGIFYEHGLGYVLCGYPSRMSIKALRGIKAAEAADTKMLRQGRSKLFYFEGPKEQVMRVLRGALEWRLGWVARHPERSRQCQ